MRDARRARASCPVTYINSTAAIKGFCGEHGGIVCTSSNAARVMAWAWDAREKLIMLPDQHLGRNTAFQMGVPLDQMVIWDPDLPYGGVDRDALRARAARCLWKGHCSVHTRFTREADRAVPAGASRRPGHRPSRVHVRRRAGRRRLRLDRVTSSARSRAVPEGSVWAVGTEIHLVNRLAREVAPARTVVTLDTLGCLCSTMFRVSPNHLLWVLDGLVDGEVHNRIVVPEPTKRWAKVALDRMLELT